MFTGIVEVGRVTRVTAGKGVLELEIDAPAVAKELHRGDSVAVNGVCLTATRARRRRFVTQAMQETLDRTSLGGMKRGSKVNLELAARPIDRLGGHIVQGHIDGVARVTETEQDGGSLRVRLTIDGGLDRYLVPKGSVTLDGISLTVIEVDAPSFLVALIPHTLEVTTLKDIAVGDEVNVEVDVIAKYVERLIER